MAVGIEYDFANVAASQTDSEIVPGRTGKRIRVTHVALVTGAAATTVTFNSKGAGAGTAISCAFACGANGGFVLPETDAGWFETNRGEALTVTTGAGSTTGIQIGFDAVS